MANSIGAYAQGGQNEIGAYEFAGGPALAVPAEDLVEDLVGDLVINLVDPPE